MDMSNYFSPEYLLDYQNRAKQAAQMRQQPVYPYRMYKQAAQPPAGDPATMGGMPPGMDPAAMGGMPPGMDPAAMGGMPPGMDSAAMGGMPADPAAMGMPPGMPADPATMGMAPAPAPAADPAADAAASPKSAKQQKEELMNGIQASLDDIKDYTYNNLMILIKIANALNVQIPAETLVSPPDGKNMDIMTDPAAISAAASAPPDQAGAMPPGATPPDAGAMPPDMAGMPAPTDMPPAEEAPSEVKMSMYRLMGIPQEQQRSENIKNAMAYLINKDKNDTINALSRLIGR